MPNEKMLTAREAAYEGILRMNRDKAYSNLLLDNILSHVESKRDRQFASQLFYGVLERDITLRWTIRQLTGKTEAKLDAEVVAALELALYQLKWMDAVPDSAAVNESVNIIKHSRKKSAAGFVNGVLRSFIRSEKEIPLPDEPLKRAEIEYAMPQWILSLWQRDYGFDTALQLAKECLGRPPLQLRVNTVLSDRETVRRELEALDVQAENHPLLPDALTVSGTGAVGALPPVQVGRCYVQDAASQLCAMAVDPQPGETVFDLCAAPGSKSFTMAQLMQNTGRILAFDLHEHRAKLVKDGAERLGLTCIEAAAADAGVYNPALGLADRVLCDVPCAGLGVIRRKPEIRRKTEKEISALPDIQLRILHNAANYLRPGGILVYSTCSLNKDENDRVAAAFLAAHPDFIPAPLPEIFSTLAEKGANSVTLMPQNGDYDGFYIVRFRKRT